MNTTTIYFTSKSGKVMSYGDAVTLDEARAYVMRNNMAARRRGDSSKPYAVLAYTITH